MDVHKVGPVVLCVALVGGSFLGGTLLLQPRSAAEPDATKAGQVNREADPAASAAKEKQPPAPEHAKEAAGEKSRTPPQARRQPAPSRPGRPLTCAEASKLGDECIGRRVSWVAQWRLSQSARIGNAEGQQHVFYTRDSQGKFSLEHPFVAEEAKPWQRPAKGQNVREFHKQRWGSTGIVTVTGTIERLETLILIGEGTRHDVPVLGDIKITINAW